METEKNKSLCHFVNIPFTGLGLYDGFRGEDWYKERARIFEDYTLKSLQNQSNQNFVLWISFRKEEKEKETTKQIEEAIKRSGVKYVLTFDGIVMWDDRGINHNDDLVERTAKTMEVLEPIVGDNKYVYTTGLGSDDMLAKDAIKEIQEQEYKDRGALYYLSGLVFNEQTKQLADWVRDTSCSKFTIMYEADTFLDANKHWEHERCLESHEFVPKCFDAKRLPDGRYCCLVHGWNISTQWENQFRGHEYYYDDEKKPILELFGIKI